jgi:adenylate kinase
VAPSGINDLFSSFGLTAKTKLLILGSADSLTGNVMNRVRSLNFEHVSPAGLMRLEISRRRTPGAADDTMALLRRWFFARKPDAGFVLTDYPATLLQAQVFDEWLEARDETLDAVLAPDPRHPAVEHYRTLGLLSETGMPSLALAKEGA